AKKKLKVLKLISNDAKSLNLPVPIETIGQAKIHAIQARQCASIAAKFANEAIIAADIAAAPFVAPALAAAEARSATAAATPASPANAAAVTKIKPTRVQKLYAEAKSLFDKAVQAPTSSEAANGLPAIQAALQSALHDGAWEKGEFVILSD